MIENTTCIDHNVYCGIKSQEIKTDARKAAENFSALFVQKMLEQNGVDKTSQSFIQDHTDNITNRILAEKMVSSHNNNIVTSIEKEILKRYE
ncbi:hypothetical protein [Vibrio sp. D431a]|uniref:hypothetical protein n=1 Tax=Vibrio sp. D431a TaxID=2837388 RepID=UPI0025572D32|nr:hypothetical protein [Vibrio sp. D431a]MDK9793913.1 hypothetical protein [Vibrio sp. D431a]